MADGITSRSVMISRVMERIQQIKPVKGTSTWIEFLVPDQNGRTAFR
jgi:hypothetical protein